MLTTWRARSKRSPPVRSDETRTPVKLTHGRAVPNARLDVDQTRSKRSRFMTLFHAATKSRTNFSFASSHA